MSKHIRLVKILLWLGAFIPLGLLVNELFLQIIPPDDPVELIQHRTGISALILLLITLSVTPFRRWTSWNWLVKLRRPLGLFAFFYATLHAFSYFVFDHSFDLAEIWDDVIEHPWVWAGFIAFVLLIPLAVTSTTGWIRRMGGKNWNRLHKLIYPIAVLGVLHFWWLVKADVSEPLLYGAILAVILGVRFIKKPTALSKPLTPKPPLTPKAPLPPKSL